MLNRSASLAMSTSVLKALPGKLDIKRHSPSILYSKRDPYLPPLAPPTHSVAAQMLQQQDVPFESVQKMELICDQESLWYLSVGESERVLLRVN